MEASPDAPRRTRATLAEIPARLDRLRVTPLRPITNTRELSPSLPPGYLSPAPSPDEFLIQQRGHFLLLSSCLDPTATSHNSQGCLKSQVL